MTDTPPQPPPDPQGQPAATPPPPAGGTPPPPGAAQPQYQGAYQGGGAVAANPFDQKATPVLVMGILGLVLCGPLGIVAWVMGNNLKRDAEAAGYTEPGTAKAGRIMGMIATIIMVAVAVLFLVLFIAGAFAASTSTTSGF